MIGQFRNLDAFIRVEKAILPRTAKLSTKKETHWRLLNLGVSIVSGEIGPIDEYPFDAMHYFLCCKSEPIDFPSKRIPVVEIY